eukprot:3272944-Pyramimonas_sp.AAC.1
MGRVAGSTISLSILGAGHVRQRRGWAWLPGRHGRSGARARAAEVFDDIAPIPWRGIVPRLRGRESSNCIAAGH